MIPMEIIATIRSDFPTKFGIPRQSGLVEELRATVVFEPEYRNPDALRGLEDFSHLWLIWQFSEAVRDKWSPTVRPPRLGGNTRMGVFATRSPFRPNPIGLSCVRLEGIRREPELGHVLEVSGADLMDGTPILDIKPYIPYADCRPEASGGFTGSGGGILMLTVFTLVLGYNLKVAVGTSTMIMTLVALTGAVSHISLGARIFPLPMAVVVLSCLLGAVVSAKFVNRCEIARLNRIVGIVLVLLGIVTIAIKLL